WLGRTAEIHRCPEGTPPAVAAERDAAGLGADARLLDSLASGMAAEGWRRLGPDDCLAEECRRAAQGEPYVASADFDGDGWLDLAMALTDGERDYVVHFRGDGELRHFLQPGMLMSSDAGLRRSSLEIADGPSLQVVNWERRWVHGPYRWDAASSSLEYAPSARPASEER
ncbi:MAG TPA: VCBS repeat-containing protein, partial [Anaeromyxobacteraceae bacterium]|nr:VCBS repeat-containing protein [Anaeromyxobacteraceae bacterium]